MRAVVTLILAGVLVVLWIISSTMQAAPLAQPHHVAPHSLNVVSLPTGQARLDYPSVARNEARAAGISPTLFVRQIDEESSFNPNVVSRAGAIGIAQFMPSTARGLGVNPWNPYASLKGAARLMASYVKRYGGDYAKALAAYNAGSGTVAWVLARCGVKWRLCLPIETQSYISIIMKGA